MLTKLTPQIIRPKPKKENLFGNCENLIISKETVAKIHNPANVA